MHRWRRAGFQALLIAGLLVLILPLDEAVGTTSPCYLVKDINVKGNSSSPCNIVDMNGTAFFSACDGMNGAELWKSDGTEAGTVMVKDICPGSGDSSPQNLAGVDGTLFFTAGDGTNGEELWKSDGTAAGTVFVKDIRPGSVGSSASQFTDVNGVLFFSANDGTNGTELWKSDGTEAGTVMVKDIYPPGFASSTPLHLADVDGTLYFGATDGTNGYELWKSDGTEAGTVMVKDINPGSGTSSVTFLTNMDGVLYFRATDGTSGYELWKSDGTEAGTVMVKDIYPGSGYSAPQFLTVMDGMLYFHATDGTNGIELWKSDGTEAGTVMVKDIRTGSGNSFPNDLVNVGGTLLFEANDGTNGSELWKSDGTAAGTVMVKDICPGSGGSSLLYLTNVNGTLFFRADDGTNGDELWKSDGTAAGTVMVKDISPGSDSSSMINLTSVGNTLYFRFEDESNGLELWKSDGTEAGTVMVKDINVTTADSSPDQLTGMNGMVFFQAGDATTDSELWKSDGTEAGTVMVKDIRPGSYGSNAQYLTNVDGTLFFRANDDTNGHELWKSDGTEAGTVMVKDIYPGSGTSSAMYLTDVEGTLFFRANNGTNGDELWKSDGTEAGTVMVKDIYPGSNISNPTYLTDVDGMLFFRAYDGTNGYELWKSDGTEAGTVMVKDICLGSGSSSPFSLTNVDGTLFFTADDGTNGEELWKSDGTEAGTVMVKDIYPGSGDSSPRSSANVDGTLFFQADDGTNGEELWKSDGTEAGTVMVKDIWPGSGDSGPMYLTNVDGTLFFIADDGTNGYELWKSDGTEAGTVMIKDIRPGSADSLVNYLTNADGVLYFRANDGTNGYELWKSNGTEAGTVMVQDIWPGSGSADPQDLLVVQGMLFFCADDNEHGNELWATTTATLALTTSSTSGGSVTDPAEGTFLYTSGTVVTIEATEDVNYHFVNWTGTGVTAGRVANPNLPSTTITMDADYAVQANFAIDQRTLTTSSSSGGSVTTPGEGAFQYDHGTTAPIAATASPNYHFVNWTGTGVTAGKVADPNLPSTTITMDADYAVQANFAIDEHNLTTTSTGGGCVTTPGEETKAYDHGTVVDLVATPDEHYHFVNWTGTGVDAGKVANPGSAVTTVTIEDDYTVQANFAIDQQTLTTSSTGGGSVTDPGEGAYDYDYGTLATIAATADENHHFVEWTGSAVTAGKVTDPGSPSTTVMMDADYGVEAVFAIDQRTLTTSSTDGGDVTDPGEGVYDYDHGTIVPIVAAADENYHFVEWTGSAVSAGKVANPSEASTTVTMDADYSVHAVFAIDRRTLSVSSTEGGSVTDPGEGAFEYDHGSSVTISADADPGYYFRRWTGTGVDAGKVTDPNEASTMITMDADYTVESVFLVNLTVLRVDDDAPSDPGPGDPDLSDPLEDGTAEHPFDCIQEAIDLSDENDTVLVLPGLYAGNGNRDMSLLGKAITVQSETGAASCVIDAEGSELEPHRAFCLDSGETQASVIGGFTITNGYTPASDRGGAILLDGSSPTITECVFDSNTATLYGGAISCINGSSPMVTLCGFEDNTALNAGGAIDCDSGDITIESCEFVGNTASQSGGAISFWGVSAPTVIDSTMAGNSTEDFYPDICGGGAVFCSNGPEVLLENCLIADNATVGLGGAMLVVSSKPVLKNCTLTGNVASLGGDGLASRISGSYPPSEITVLNSILWNGGDEVFQDDGATITVTYSCVQDTDPDDLSVYPGVGNIDDDPLFATGTRGDYYLSQVIAGQASDSPCLDSGNDTALNLGYWDVTTRTDDLPDTGAVDMGYHYQSDWPTVATMYDMERDDATGLVRISWTSREGATYRVDSSTSPYNFDESSMNWTMEASGLASGGCLTTWEDAGTPSTGEKYYRVYEEDATGDTPAEDTVGLMWLPVRPSRNMMSTPFLPYPEGGGIAGVSTFDKIIGNQLTGHAVVKTLSDIIQKWNSDTLTWSNAWYRTGVGWIDYDTGGDAMPFCADAGYWVLRNAHPFTNIMMFGKVEKVERSVNVDPGRNLLGSAYPVTVALDDTGLVASGFAGHAVVKTLSDQLLFWDATTLSWRQFWYKTGEGFQPWNSYEPMKDIVPGDAYYLLRQGTTGFTWTYPCPE